MKKSMLFEAVAVLLLIVLIFTLYVMVTSAPASPGQWTLSGYQVSSSFGQSMYIGPNNVLYVVSGDKVDAISPDSRILWQVPVPISVYTGSILFTNDSWTGEQAAFDGHMIYLLAAPSHMFISAGSILMAISDNGSLVWYKQLNQDTLTNNPSGTSIIAGGDQLYLHTGNIETAYDKNGKLLWHLSNINAGRSVDENGDLYVMPGDGAFTAVDAYGPNGILKWEYGLGNDSFSQDYSGDAGVAYHDHTVYAVLAHGLLSLDENGNLLWKKTFDGNYVYMDMVGDNWYVQHQFFGENNSSSYVSMVGPDGIETIPPRPPEFSDVVVNGTLITQSSVPNPNNRLDDLNAYLITGYNATTGNEVWNFTIAPEKIYNTTLNESNVANVMYEEVTPGGNSGDAWEAIQTNMLTPQAWYTEHSIPYGSESVRNYSVISLTPCDRGVYVCYWAYNYQYPFFFNQSKCTYAGGLYALDYNGALLWEKPIDSEVTAIAANNSTVYYSTKTGQLSTVNSGMAAGLALAAAFYLFIRFFMAGAVTRARGRIDSNENRNLISKYIAGNPGASLYDISRGLKINMGTARYHLMILGINHRIVSYRADEKYVRYFTNAGSYSREQQFMVSIMKREGIKKVLNALMEKPGMSNVELSREMGLQESAASRYMKELFEKGIVAKEQTGDGRLSYAINKEYREPIAFAVERLNDR